MIDRDKIDTLVKSYLERESLFLVDITVSGDNDIEVTIDSYDTVTIDNCADLSRIIEEGLDRNTEDFSLTVTSAGLDKPFKIFEQYKKNIGKEVIVVLKNGEKIIATLTDADRKKITLEWVKSEKSEKGKKRERREERVSFEYEEIKSTRISINFK